MTEIIPLIFRQERFETVLMCKGFGDVRIYTFPESMSPSQLDCDKCGNKCLTSKIERSKQF